jgi:hypothetical protein
MIVRKFLVRKQFKSSVTERLFDARLVVVSNVCIASKRNGDITSNIISIFTIASIANNNADRKPLYL